MDELLFSAMDVPKEVRKILDKRSDDICKGMTNSERMAYDFGLETVLGLTRCLLEMDEEPVIHIKGLDAIEEMSIEELEERFLK